MIEAEDWKNDYALPSGVEGTIRQTRAADQPGAGAAAVPHQRSHPTGTPPPPATSHNPTSQKE